MPSPPALAALIPPTARRVLDVGCGTGDTGRLIKDRLPGCWVGGIELDRARAAEARTRLDAVIDDPGAGLPFERGWFDAIVVADALAQLADPRPLLRDLRAYLAPRGLLVASAPAAATSVAQHVDALHRALGGPRVPDQDAGRRYRRDEIVDLLSQTWYEPTSLRALRDPGAAWIPPPLDGARLDLELDRLTLRDLSAEELAATGAREFLVTALPRPAEATPDCSIVIIGEDLERLRACVAAIRQDPPRGSREIIAVLVGATVAADDAAIPGVLVLANREALTPGAARNQGARHALGHYLVFLHGASRPRPGWLDALVESARSRPGVGAVGSKLLSAEGAIAGAGVALGGRDLPLQPLPYRLYGGAPATAPFVNQDRVTSAAAGSGLLVPRRALVAVEGFDESYESWYGEADLSLALRARGLTVRYCPASVVVEPDAGDDDPPEGDVDRFRDRWCVRLVPDDELLLAADGTDLATAYGSRPPARPAGGSPPVVWTGAFFERAGYAEGARSFALALDRAGFDVQANPLFRGPLAVELPESHAARLGEIICRRLPDRFVHVVHATPVAHQRLAAPPYQVPVVRFRRHPRAVRHIGRTMLETDRIPADWAALCNEMDEVWVPSTFARETFAASGVARDRLHVVPEALPLDPFETRLPPYPVPGAAGFVFLSVFAWGWRKGWDVTLRAYVEEFRRGDPVSLVLHVTSPWGQSLEDHRREVEAFLRSLGLDPAATPPVVLIGASLSAIDMVRLYRAADAFVLASRGEAWGRPYMEAMAAGVPAIGTRWSGHLDFMSDDNAYLIDCSLARVPERVAREVTYYQGGRMAEPSAAHLRTLMRRVVEERGEAAGKAVRGQQEVLERYRWSRVAAIIGDRLGVTPSSAARAPARPLRVAWEGSHATNASLAVVNRAVCRELASSPAVALTVVTGTPARERRDDQALARRLGPAPPESDVHVRHEWPPSFAPPRAGRWVLNQPWEYGSVPQAWVEPIDQMVDEVWVPSRHVRTMFVRSGIDPRRVVVVPNGVDPARFRPDQPPRPLPGDRGFRFLFVGGTLPRKGADILIDTYLTTFGPGDGVCLVVKDQGTRSFYRGQGLGERIRALAADPRCPAMVYLDDDLPAEAMPGLYTACHCLVHPYRGEGFGLPILEAMACGLPVIVPALGPAAEYCDPDTAYVIPATELRLADRHVAGVPTVDVPWLVEVDRVALKLAMRRVVERPDEARERGRRASERARREFSWARVAGVVRERVEDLRERPIRRRMPVAARPRRRELSVCIVARADEQHLARCVTSVRDVADEIVVAGGAWLRDAAAPGAAGARVVPVDDDASRAAARNAALAHATRDWVLVLEAEETLDPDSQEEVRRLLRPDAVVGFLVHVRRHTEGPGGPSVVERTAVRLMPAHAALRYGAVPEQPISLAADLRLELAPCGVLLHRSFTPARDLARLERLAMRCPDDIDSLGDLGAAYLALGHARHAEEVLRRLIALGGAAGAPTAAARAALARALVAQGRADEAIVAGREAVDLAPHLADAWCALGLAELRRGRAEAAVEAWERALASPGPIGADESDHAARGWRAWLGLGQAELAAGWPERAITCLERAGQLEPRAPEVAAVLGAALTAALERGPGDARLHRMRGELLAARGDLDGALQALRRALEIDALDPQALAATGRVLRALGATAEGDQALEAASRLAAARPR